MALNETTKKQLKEFLQDEQVLTKNDVIHDHSHEEKHHHATRSFDKFCPECSEENPDFKEPEFFCENCRSPIGSEDDAQKSKACYNCGATEAVTKEIMEEL